MQPNDYVDYFFDIKNKADVDLDWQTFMPQYYAAKGVFPESAKDSWLLWIKPQVKRAPVPIRSVRDFLWWFSFSLQWQHATTWLHGFHALSGENAINDIEHFFATDDFQQWSYHNRTLESAKYKVRVLPFNPTEPHNLVQSISIPPICVQPDIYSMSKYATNCLLFETDFIALFAGGLL